MNRDFNEFGGGFQERFRAGRGMMEPAILQALTTKPMHGYEIISAIEEKTHGMWRPSAGSIYPTLQLLEEKDLLTSSEIDSKKVYSLTEAGKVAAEEVKDRHEGEFKDRLRRFNGHHGGHEFRKEFGPVFGLIRDIFKKGNEEQQAALLQALRDFRHNVEMIAGEAKQ